MKIFLEQDRFESDGEIDTFNYDMKAEFTISDDATTIEAVGAFYKILKVAGYSEKTIIKAMYDVADYYKGDEYVVNVLDSDLNCDPDGTV